MISEQKREEVESLISHFYDLGRHGDYFAEAKGNWLESCLECDHYHDDSDSLSESNLDYYATNWLEDRIQEAPSDDTAPGGIYHWMVQALEGK
jgi:hypothetical protein